MECDFCKHWVHAECAGWTEAAYAAVKQQPGFRFYCSTCLPNIDALTALKQELFEFKDELASTLVAMEA